jgi:hypothetical protein
MAEEIRLDVVSVAHSKGLKDAAGDLGRLSSESDKAAKGLHRAADESFNLDRAIAEARVELQRTNEEFRRTGDTTLFRNMRRQRSELAQLLKAASEGVSGAGNAASQAFDFGGKGIRPRNALIAGAVGAVAILSPLIGAMIGGAVVGAVGTGGMVGGIAAASKDPRVRTAAKEFGSVVTSEFFRSGDAFVEPTVRSLGLLSGAMQDIDLAGAFAKGAPSVEIIASGIANLAENTMPGLNKMLERSPQAAAIAAQGFSDIGDALSEMLTDIAETEGSMEGLRALFDITSGTIRVLGNTISWLGDRFLSWNQANQAVSGSFEDISKWWPLLIPMQKAMEYSNNQAEKWMGTGENMTAVMFKMGESTSDLTTRIGAASDSWNPYAGQVEIVRKHQEQLNDAMRESISIALSLDNATLGLQQAMLDLGEQLQENKGEWATSTQAGLDNRRALLNAVEAAERKRQADIASGKSADVANAAYQRTIDKLVAMAKRAGISEKALRDLVGDYNVTVHYRTAGSYKPPAAILEAKGRATGGPVGAGTYIVGERGPEVLELGQGSRGHVYPSIGAFAGGRGRGSSSGGGSVRIVIEDRTSGGLRARLVDDALGRGIRPELVRAAYP